MFLRSSGRESLEASPGSRVSVTVVTSTRLSQSCREVLVTLTELEFHISHRVGPRCWWLALWIAWEAAQLLLYYCSSPPVQPLPSSTQRSPGFLMAGFGAVSADSSDQGLLLQDCSPGWHLVSVVDFDGYTVQLTPASQKKKKKADSVPCSMPCSAFCLLWPSSSV